MKWWACSSDSIGPHARTYEPSIFELKLKKMIKNGLINYKSIIQCINFFIFLFFLNLYTSYLRIVYPIYRYHYPKTKYLVGFNLVANRESCWLGWSTGSHVGEISGAARWVSILDPTSLQAFGLSFERPFPGPQSPFCHLCFTPRECVPYVGPHVSNIHVS